MNIDSIVDCGTQITEVAQTFNQHGRCVGCGESHDGWCGKHRQWAYTISRCRKEPVAPKRKVEKHLSERTAHNAKPVKCSNGITYQSMFLAAKAFGISAQHLRKTMQAGKDYATYKFEYAEVGI